MSGRFSDTPPMNVDFIIGMRFNVLSAFSVGRETM